MTEETKTMNDLQSDAAHLAAVLDGVDLLYGQCDTKGEVGEMAANALVALISDARRQSRDLADGLDRLDRAGRRHADASA